MAELGVGTGIHYPTPIHLQRGARERCEVPATPKRAEQWAGELLSLPMFPGLTRPEGPREGRRHVGTRPPSRNGFASTLPLIATASRSRSILRTAGPYDGLLAR